mgnify:CR=1 FL=1
MDCTDNVCYIRMHFLDASALVKYILFPDIPESIEPGSKNINEYIKKGVCLLYTNNLCLAEAFIVLKTKYFGSKARKVLNFDGYLIVINRLKGRIKRNLIEISKFDYLADNNLEKAIEIIEKYQIDLFDALQIVDVKYGQSSSFRRKSQTLLITADENLANAAKKEGVKVWYCINEPVPE